MRGKSGNRNEYETRLLRNKLNRVFYAHTDGEEDIDNLVSMFDTVVTEDDSVSKEGVNEVIFQQDGLYEIQYFARVETTDDTDDGSWWIRPQINGDDTNSAISGGFSDSEDHNDSSGAAVEVLDLDDGDSLEFDSNSTGSASSDMEEGGVLIRKIG